MTNGERVLVNISRIRGFESVPAVITASYPLFGERRFDVVLQDRDGSEQILRGISELSMRRIPVEGER